jgi:SAM-dependent methyltransferase
MPLTLKSTSPIPISDPNLPIALRPAVDFTPVRGSIFDDPGDEKSWYVSQRSEELTRYFEGREPSWYASAISPLEGADRVLDLGCGLGLTLQALLDQGSTSVLGVDRWPAFTARSTPSAPIIAHDLTLPMPFLESGSFDGVLSHYALDYVSPIGMRQVLREAHRVLAPGGRLVVYVAAVGMGSGDAARTVAYSPPALRALLEEAGFDGIDVRASSNGRNSVAQARCTEAGLDSEQTGRAEAWAAIEGDTQLSASFSEAGDTLEFELAGSGCRVVLAVDLPPARSSQDSRVALCARALRLAAGGTELQLWAWRGYAPVVSECARLEFAATEMRMSCAGGELEHVAAWSPGELALEPPGNACARLTDLAPGGDLSEAERGAEGKQIVVEPPADAPADVEKWLGPGRNRLLIRQVSGIDVATIDREWLSGRAHGIAVAADELHGQGTCALLLWAGWRQSLIYLGGSDWEAILSAAVTRQSELRSPVILVDPALWHGGSPEPVPPNVVTFVERHGQCLLLLGAESRHLSDADDLAQIPKRVLHGGPTGDDTATMRQADETLRHLTERTVLMRLRQAFAHSPAEVGRREAH